MLDLDNLDQISDDAAAFEFLEKNALVALFLVVAAVSVCLFFCGVVYVIMHYLLPRLRSIRPDNTVAEAVLGLVVLIALPIAIFTVLRSAAVVFLPEEVLFLCEGSGLFGSAIMFRLLVTVFSALFTLFLLAFLAMKGSAGGMFRFWGLAPFPGKTLFRFFAVIFLVIVAYLPVHIALSFLWSLFLFSIDRALEMQQVLSEPLREGGLTLLVTYILAISVVPLYEEILFRGVLYGACRKSMGILPAILLSSVVFAAFHGQLSSFGPLFGLAVLLACVYEWSGSLWCSVCLHALFNCISFTVTA